MSPVLLFLLSCLLAQLVQVYFISTRHVMLQPLQKLDVFVLDREPGKSTVKPPKKKTLPTSSVWRHALYSLHDAV